MNCEDLVFLPDPEPGGMLLPAFVVPSVNQSGYSQLAAKLVHLVREI